METLTATKLSISHENIEIWRVWGGGYLFSTTSSTKNREGVAYTVVPHGAFQSAFHFHSHISCLCCLFHFKFHKFHTHIAVFGAVVFAQWGEFLLILWETKGAI